MASNDSDAGVGIIVGLVLIGIAIYIMVIVTLWIVGITLVAATTVGGSVSLYNYGVAFKNNVKPERPTR